MRHSNPLNNFIIHPQYINPQRLINALQSLCESTEDTLFFAQWKNPSQIMIFYTDGAGKIKNTRLDTRQDKTNNELITELLRSITPFQSKLGTLSQKEAQLKLLQEYQALIDIDDLSISASTTSTYSSAQSTLFSTCATDNSSPRNPNDIELMSTNDSDKLPNPEGGELSQEMLRHDSCSSFQL